MKMKLIFASLGLFCFSQMTTANADILPGFDQRLEATNFDATTGVLTDSVSATQNATAVGGSFGLTTTPNGAPAIRNIDALGDTGERLEFTRDTVLGGTSGFTIQAVFSGNSVPGGDTAGGIIGLNETAGFSGLFLGASPATDVELRAGNVNGVGNVAGAFLNQGTADNLANTAAVDQFAIYTLVVDPNAAAGQVVTASIDDPLSGANLLSVQFGDPDPALLPGGNSIDGIGNIGGFFAGEVGTPNGQFNIQDNFNGALADVVIYNFALDEAQLAANTAYFTEGFFVEAAEIPEPSSTLVLAGLLGSVCLRRRR